MKKILLSLASMYALGSLSYAGGDIVPVKEPETVLPTVKDSTYYLGLGLGSASVNNDFTSEEISNFSVMLQAGYQYNEYVALEGRYTFGFNTDYDPGITANQESDYEGDLYNWGIYVKPMYPIGDFAIYALLGYGGVTLTELAGGDAYESGFQWGIGASYALNETVSVFVDYLSLYDDKGFDYRAEDHDIDADTWTIGVSYKF